MAVKTLNIHDLSQRTKRINLQFDFTLTKILEQIRNSTSTKTPLGGNLGAGRTQCYSPRDLKHCDSGDPPLGQSPEQAISPLLHPTRTPTHPTPPSPHNRATQPNHLTQPHTPHPQSPLSPTLDTKALYKSFLNPNQIFHSLLLS